MLTRTRQDRTGAPAPISRRERDAASIAGRRDRSSICLAWTTTRRASRSRCCGSMSSTPAYPRDDRWSAVAEKGFDDPALFAVHLRTQSWNCVTATDPNLFQAPFRVGIRIDAYQLDPLRKALRLPCVNPVHRRRCRPRQDH